VEPSADVKTLYPSFVRAISSSLLLGKLSSMISIENDLLSGICNIKFLVG